jgi:ATP-binding cassette, subfamily B, bacterial
VSQPTHLDRRRVHGETPWAPARSTTKPAAPPTRNNGLVRHLRPHLRPYRGPLLLGAFFAVLQVGTKLAEPWPLAWLVDNALRPENGAIDRDAVVPLVLVALLSMCAIVGAGALLDYWSTRLLTSSGLRVGNDLRAKVFVHLHRQSLGYHEQHQVGDLTSRVTSDVDRTQDLLVQLLATLLPNALLLVGVFLVMLKLDPFLTLLGLATTPILVVITYRSKVALRHASKRARRADGEVASATTESLAAMGLVQAYTLERQQAGRFQELADDSLEAGVEAARLQARFSPLVDGASLASTVVVMGVGAIRVADGTMKLGVFLVVLSYMGSLYKPIKALSKLASTMSKGMAAADRIIDVLDAEPTIADQPDAILAPPFAGTVELRNVTFSYGRESVLRDISLTFHAGETVALVGPTGAGKSTIAALIPRLIDPQQGAVLVDGLDVRRCTIPSLRSQISMVLQDTVLLKGSIRDNIGCGRPGSTDHAVERAARLALVDEFALRLPDGLDTRVGERGVDLSGGQRQRIAIARAILRDAPILILDEPTSALDGQSEELIVHALEHLPRTSTTIVIAHRLSTVRRADRLVVLAGGQIVETGTHDQLLAAGGLYSRLAAGPTAKPNPTVGFLGAEMPPPSVPIIAGVNAVGATR